MWWNEGRTGCLSVSLQVLVKDPLGKPVKNVRVRLTERRLYTRLGNQEEMPCPTSSTSQSNGLAIFICNTPRDALRVELKVGGAYVIPAYLFVSHCLYMLFFTEMFVMFSSSRVC